MFSNNWQPTGRHASTTRSTSRSSSRSGTDLISLLILFFLFLLGRPLQTTMSELPQRNSASALIYTGVQKWHNSTHSRLANWSCNAQNTADSQTLFSQIVLTVDKKAFLALYTHIHLSRSSVFLSLESRYRKRVCVYLLVRHCNYGLTLHRFWDTATSWLKIAYFCYPSLIRRPSLPVFPLEFRAEVTARKLESWGYPPVKTPWS